MKTVISCDSILKRDHSTEVIESLLEIYKDATLFTLAHNPGQVLGIIEQRQISSTQLSRKVTDANQIFEYSYLIPTLCKKLFIPCTTDLIINVSHGLSQGIKKCRKTRQITYLYDLFWLQNRKLSFIEKFFSAYLKNWAIKSLKQADIIWVSHESLANELIKFDIKSEVVSPGIKVDDYPIVPVPKDEDYILINSSETDQKELKTVIDYLNEKKIKYFLVGHGQEDLVSKLNIEEKNLLGNKCSGELAPLMSGAKAFIDFSNEVFAVNSLYSLSTGTPVLKLDRGLRSQIGPKNGVYYCKESSSEAIQQSLSKLIQEENSLEPQNLRSGVMPFHFLKFKAKVRREIER